MLVIFVADWISSAVCEPGLSRRNQSIISLVLGSDFNFLRSGFALSATVSSFGPCGADLGGRPLRALVGFAPAPARIRAGNHAGKPHAFPIFTTSPAFRSRSSVEYTILSKNLDVD